jgi:octaheme c-type cytochrome (tetrathionate reductase family)
MQKKLLLFILVLFFGNQLISQEITSDSSISFPIINYTFKENRNMNSSVDHSKFDILQEKFNDAHDLTLACLSCHTERDKEIMATSHWNWERSELLPGKGVVALGKKNILNNFCIGIRGSEKTCTRCHIGYGWEDNRFDFHNPANIDCVVCHDQTGTYEKESGKAGYPKESVDLNYVAQNVGSPKRENCGICHFWGGGGNNVKHGDLEKSMNQPSRDIDVHMDIEGEDMSCVECHKTEKHQMKGKLYALSSEDKNRAYCTDCHTNKPHVDNILNQHINRIACQTCHIPLYAKANSTKMIWDWSTAGNLDEIGKPMHENDADGNHNYLSIKGNFVYDDHVVPDYCWFNGTANHHLIEEEITEIPVQMNTLYGKYDDQDMRDKGASISKIWPVKVHRGKQIFDTIHKKLIQPKLWAEKEGDGAYWKDFNWDKASKLGMDYADQNYSGEYGFIETEMYWPLNHMVAPADQSLKCVDCHVRKDGRLANLTGFYLPGRDFNPIVETAGISLMLAAIIGIAFHAFCRIVFRGRCKNENE